MDDDLFEELSELKKSPEKKSEDNKESSDPTHLHFGYFKHPIHFGLDQIFCFFFGFFETLKLFIRPFTSLMVSYLQLIFQNQSVEKIDLFNNINGSLRNILQEKSRTVINLNEDKNGDETDDGSENADLEKKIVEAEDLTNKLKNVQMVKVKVVQADSNEGDAIDVESFEDFDISKYVDLETDNATPNELYVPFSIDDK